MRLTRPILYVVSALVFLSFLFAGCAGQWIGKGFPKPGEDSVPVSGIGAPVRIEYDSSYIPHIKAKSETDAMFALGYTAASARLFQMDIMRKVARGEATALLGPKSRVTQAGTTHEIDVLEADLFMRMMDFLDSGRRLLDMASPESKAALAAYAKGVNAFTEQNKSRLPAPYSVPKTLGGKTFDPWKSEDSAAIMMLMAWALSKNYEDEYFAILALQEDVPLPKIVDLISPYYGLKAGNYEYLTALAPKMHGMRFMSGFDQYRALTHGKTHIGPFGGSNNWVVSGKKTKSKKPILANDPHLPRSVPSFWYFAQVTIPDYDVIGAMPPGIPVAFVGHNGKVAWGNTMVRSDQADACIETINPENKTFKRGDQWLPMVEKKIRVGTEKDFLERTIYATDFGPIFTFVEHGVETAVSMRWTGWFPSKSLDASLNLARVKNVAEARKNLEDLGLISVNLVYADVDGGIGWSVTGDIPTRKGYTGLLPRDGADPKMDWTGYLSLKNRPGGLNPESGIIATANNRAESQYADSVGSNYVAPYRHDRIVQLLKDKNDLTPEDIRKIQADTYSLQAERVLPFVLSIKDNDPDVETAIRGMRNWNKYVNADSRGALYYETFITHFILRVAKDLPVHSREAFVELIPFRQQVVDALARKETTLWSSPEERDRVILDALKSSIRELKARFGDRLETATWGDAHKMYLEHPLSSVTMVGEKYKLPPLPYPGDANTVNPGGGRQAVTYDVEMISSLRFIADLSAPDKARFSMPAGQSEIPTHPSYSNLLQTWYKVEDDQLLYSDEDLKKAAVPARLTLEPVK